MNDLAFERAATAVNALGVELYGALAGAQRNFLVSPLSIQLAMSMTAMGAAGATAEEMHRVLRLGDGAIDELVLLSRSLARNTNDVTLDLANRIFVRRGFDVRPAFLEVVAKGWGAAPEALDFADAEAARREINDWVLRATHEKIRELVPPGSIDEATRLVLTNALYLRAAWAEPFARKASPEDFLVDGAPVKVPTMSACVACGQASLHGAQILALPFVHGALQLVAIVPKKRDGLDDLAHIPAWLDRAAHLAHDDAIVHLPKFRVEPATLALSDALRALGLETTFDHPSGSANFDAMAPRTPDAYLFVGEVLHKSFIAVDEHGVEAAAATAVMVPLGMGPPPRKSPPVIRVDRPFIFAVQHAASGACLFLGRVTDPR